MKLVLPLLCLLFPQSLFADESVEPMLPYTLKIGERSYEISEGKPFEVDPVAAKSPAVLQADAHRVFSYQNLRFKYPNYFAFEANVSGPSDKNWKLSGNDCKILILTFKGVLTPHQFAENLAKTFGKENTQISESKVAFGKVEYHGALLNTVLAGSRIRMEVLPMTSPKDWTKLFVIQDNIGGDGTHSKEYQKVMDVLQESFTQIQSGESGAAPQP